MQAKVFLLVRFVLPLMLLASLLPAQGPHIVAISHRGEHLRHPENTLPAYQAAIDAGADFIETDVRTTADGKLAIQHDATVNRCTNGQGAVRGMTLAQIRALDAGVKTGEEFLGTRVPTFDEVLALARGKIGVYVDSKDISAADLVAALDRHDMEDHVVVYGRYKLMQDIAALRPNIRLMPEANTADHVKMLADTLHLKVIAFDARDFQDDIIAAARAAKAAIYVDRLGEADNPKSWQDAIDRGASGIQTNLPSELVRYLRSKGYHR
ncbi:MAG: glycerophosphodiester phosphodiesterase family protein [Bryobacteraceae bacterium]